VRQRGLRHDESGGKKEWLEGRITLQAGPVTMLDWKRLREAGEFDPTYLHIKKEAA